MGNVFSYLTSGHRKAQSAGLSPSPTDDTGPKILVPSEEPLNENAKTNSSTTEEKPPEEPESNDTSYGVEATAVRTLAASTGTVAILGTTAKVKESFEDLSIIDEDLIKDTPTISVTEAEPNDESIDVEEPQQKDVEEIPVEDLKALIEPKEETKEKTMIIEEAEKSGALGTEKNIKPTNDQKEEELNIKQADNLELKELEEEIKQENQPEQENHEKLEPTLKEEPQRKENLEPKEEQEPTPPVLKKEPEKYPVRIVEYQEKKDINFEKFQEEVKPSDLQNEVETEKSEVTVEERFGSLEFEDNNSKDPINDSNTSPSDVELKSEEIRKLSVESELGSPDASKTEDNEISSEQLKTNSPSDMSLSEVMNSEGEEFAREAAKAQELQEMVQEMASQSAASNVFLSIGVGASGETNKDLKPLNYSAGTSISKGNDSQEDISDQSVIDITIEKNKPSPVVEEESSMDESLTEKPVVNSNDVGEFQACEPPSELSEACSNGSNEDSKQTEESKLSDKDENSELFVPENQSLKAKKCENDTVEEKEIDETEIMGLENIQVKDTTKEDIKQDPNSDETIDSIEEKKIIAAATTIQSTFRGFQTRKKLKEGDVTDEEESENNEEIEQTSVKDFEKISENNKVDNKEKKEVNIDVQIVKEKTDDHKSSGELMDNNEIEKVLKTIEPFDAKSELPIEDKNYSDTQENRETDFQNMPDNILKIAIDEVDRICKEAEKASETLITPPPLPDSDNVNNEFVYDLEGLPLPPPDLIEIAEKSSPNKEDQDSSATLSTEPTAPLGSNTDSSKTEDTTAPSLVESEIKSTQPTPFQQTQDDNRLESSLTDNINTEVAVNLDSTEGELTMEEDSKDEELGSNLHSNKGKEDKNKDVEKQNNEDKAAAVIQAGYRGFKTRKELGADPQKVIASSNSPDDSQISPSEGTGDLSSSSKSDEELNDFATKIQAGVRGYLVRKEQKVKRDAAVKIQSSFRGFQTRQKLKQDSP